MLKPNPARTIEWYREEETRYPELIAAHSVSVAWNGRQVDVTRADSEQSAQQLAELFKGIDDSPLLPLGERLYQLLIQHKEFVVQAGKLFPSTASSQGVIAQDAESCVACGIGTAGHYYGAWRTGAACLTGLAGCLVGVFFLLAETYFTARACGRCGTGGSDSGGNPPPPCNPSSADCPAP